MRISDMIQIWWWCVTVILFGGSFTQAAQTEHCLSVSIPLSSHKIIETDAGHRVYMDDFGVLHEPGVPQLPMRIFPIAIPSGAEVVQVTFTTADPLTLPARYDVAPAPIWQPVSQENERARVAEQQRFDVNHAAIYGTDDLYPATPVKFERTAGYHGYNLLDVRVTPLAYRPQSGRLLRYEEITVHVLYRLPKQRNMQIIKPSPTIVRSARDLILNYDQAAAWSMAPRPRDADPHEFVVITLESLLDAVAPLITWEQQKGRNTQVVTTQWIAANYTGVDLAEQVRNFLRDKYPADAWGIEHVLLVGHYSDLPMRVVWQDLGYGHPYTDTYYAELTLPDNQSWDSDGDGRYAEEEDQIDFYNEVCVGRIPWSDPAIVQHICEKSVLSEQNHDPSYKRNILLLGAFTWPDTDSAVLMETIAALPHLSDWTGVRMYELGYSAYPMNYDITNANVVAEWSGDTYAVVTWSGHGSPTSAHRYYPDMPAFITSADCAVLNDDYPSIVFAHSCYTSCPEYANLGREMLYQGAVGYVGATQVAGGRKAWQVPADGSAQTLNYLFNSYVTSGVYTQGEALQRALRETYLQGAWRWPKYEVLEWGALYGNPDLGIGLLPALHIQFPDGLPVSVAPGFETTIAVCIDPVQDTLVAGSETLHYRLDGGAFQTATLTSLGNKFYEAVLPAAHCDDVPEFYVSAQGTVSGLVTQPEDAPSEAFTMAVGTYTPIYDYDFEEYHAWMVENLGATDGMWQREIPVNDPNCLYDPFADADGSGKCALTANRPGDSDVDGGGVRLTSPVVDMTAENILLQYSYYLYVDDQTEPDYLLVEVSSNGLAGPWLELVRHIRNNGLSWRTDSFTGVELQALGITLTDQMHVRYTVYDGGSDHVVEAGVDAFKVLSFGCTDVWLGDLNCDGSINALDIDPFVLALTDPVGYTSSYPHCDNMLADCNDDGSINSLDIDPFVDLLTGG